MANHFQGEAKKTRPFSAAVSQTDHIRLARQGEIHFQKPANTVGTIFKRWMWLVYRVDKVNRESTQLLCEKT
jgi:hypothetical protein